MVRSLGVPSPYAKEFVPRCNSTQWWSKTCKIRIIRRDEVSRRTGRRETAIASDVKAGLLPPAINIGRRAVGWPEHEVDAVVRARIMGMPPDEIRELVTRLVRERAKLADVVTE